MNKIITNK